MPIYTACILLGAIDPRCPGLRLSLHDAERYGFRKFRNVKEK